MNEEKSKQTLKAFIIGLSLLVIGIALIVVGMVFDKVQRDAFIPTFKGDKYAPIWYIYLLEMGGALLFLLSFGGIYTFLAEKLKWKRMNVKQMSVIAIFAALSVILYYFAKFNLPFFPSWLDIQFSDVPAILVTFMYGPFSGVITVFVRFFCKLPGTSTVGVGEMADLLIGLAMVIPAGLIYKNAFAKRDITAKKYEKFIKSENTKVNAKTLYPYEIVNQVVKNIQWRNDDLNMSDIDRMAVEKYWNNLPNYFEGGRNQSILCVVDTSGSMTGSEASAPINMAIALGIYAGERCTGDFHNYYISFSSRPQLIKIEGSDFADKVRRIYATNLVSNTDLKAVFDLLLNTVRNNPRAAFDLPDTIVVISDMEIDHGSYWRSDIIRKTEMQSIREQWARCGLQLPKLVYWNVDARNDTILDDGDGVSFVSGGSPVLFEQVCKGINGYDLMLDKINSPRYQQIVLD